MSANMSTMGTERSAGRRHAPALSRPRSSRATPRSATLRGYGIATGDLRPLPDFLVIGAKRGGTTSLWRYLSEHDGILNLFPRPEKIKGLYYFDENFGRGERWYRSHFPSVATRALASRRLGSLRRRRRGDAVLPVPPARADPRARCRSPTPLIVVVLRDPVERAFSHFKERRTNGTEPLSFARSHRRRAGAPRR